MPDTPEPTPQDEREASFRRALERMHDDPAEAARIASLAREAEATELHYLPRRLNVEWTSAKGNRVVARVVGPVAHRRDHYYFRTNEENSTRCIRHKSKVTPLISGGVPVERVTSAEQLRSILDIIGYPVEGHQTLGSGIRAEVYGFHLDNLGSWPMEDNTHIGVQEPVAGCPRPVSHPAHTELYLRLFKGAQAVADVNLASLLAWCAFGPRPEPRVDWTDILAQPGVRDLMRAAEKTRSEEEDDSDA